MIKKTPAEGKANKIDRPSQSGYAIELNSKDHSIKQVWIRFGRKVSEEVYDWDSSTRVIGPVDIKPGQTKVQLAVVNEDELPVPAGRCYYQLLCTVDNDNDHGDKNKDYGAIETLMTDPKLLQDNALQ